MHFLYSIFAFIFRFLFSFVNNYGVALIIFAVFFRLILIPTSVKQQKSMAKMNRLQPKLKRIREKYQDYNPQERQQKIQQETSELYQREGYSSMGASCLPTLLQMPVLFGLYGVVIKPLTYVLQLSEEALTALSDAAKTLLEASGRSANYVESMVISNIEAIVEANPDLATKFAAEVDAIRNFNFTLFGMDLGAIPKQVYADSGITMATIFILAIPVLAGVSSLLTSLVTTIRQKKSGAMDNQQMMGCMMFMMPVWTVFLAWGFPVGMGMYWILSSLIAFFQTLILGSMFSPRKTVARQMVEETIERRSLEKSKKTAIENETETQD